MGNLYNGEFKENQWKIIEEMADNKLYKIWIYQLWRKKINAKKEGNPTINNQLDRLKGA